MTGPKTPQTADPIAALKQEVLDQGKENTITVWRGEIIETTRLVLCLQLEIIPNFNFLDDNHESPPRPPLYTDAELSLTEGQRAMAAAKLSMDSRHGRPSPENTGAIPTIAQAAQKFGVSERTVQRARKVLTSGYKPTAQQCLLPTSSLEYLSISQALGTVERLEQSFKPAS